MKEFASVLIATAILIGATAVAIHGFGDRELFVSPPDAVAEGFMREVVTERFDQASEYVSDNSARDLRALARATQAVLGRVNEVDAKTISSTKDEALVNIRLRSAKGSKTLAMKIVWDGARWKVVIPH